MTATKSPKRRVKRTVYGNLATYEGRTRTGEINVRGIEPYTEVEKLAAAAFLAGHDDWYDRAWAAL